MLIEHFQIGIATLRLCISIWVAQCKMGVCCFVKMQLRLSVLRGTSYRGEQLSQQVCIQNWFDQFVSRDWRLFVIIIVSSTQTTRRLTLIHLKFKFGNEKYYNTYM